MNTEHRSEFPEGNTLGTGDGANRRSRFCLLGIYDWGQCGGMTECCAVV